MQSGSINCPSHGSVVSCSGADGAALLVGTCPYGGETITMGAQASDGPFAHHWNPSAPLGGQTSDAIVEPDGEVVDLEKLVADVAYLKAENAKLHVRVAALEAARAAVEAPA